MKSISYLEFVERFKSGEIIPMLNKSLVTSFVSQHPDTQNYKAAITCFSALVWIGSIVGVILLFFVWPLALFVLFVCWFPIRSGIIKTAQQQALRASLECPRFYADAISAGVLSVCKKNSGGVVNDLDQAASQYRMLSDQGDADAQCHLGNCYFYGRGVIKDLEQAAFWYHKSADQGNRDAQFYLGECYQTGEGVQKNIHQAVFWYRKSADQGHAPSQNLLGWCYYHGRGVIKDLEQAVFWFRKSADQGYEKAQYSLEKIQPLDSPPL